MDEKIVVKQKNPKKVEAGKKGHQTKLLKMKEQILKDESTGSTSASTPASTGSTPASTGSTSASTTHSSYNVYMLGVGALSILAIGCVVWCYLDLGGKKAKEKPSKEGQQQKQQKFKPML